MQHSRLLPLLPLVVLAACNEDRPPTAPAEPGGPAFSHTAGHLVVNSLADPGDGTCNATQCTLREAIDDPASIEISFAQKLSGIISLDGTSGQLTIDKPLAITGPSIPIIIRRRGTDPNEFRVFEIGQNGTVRLANLILIGGKVSDRGGGILNFGVLSLTNSVVAGSSAGSGAGLFNDGGAVTLTNSAVLGNSASGPGGGIGNDNGGTLAIRHSTVLGNSARPSGGDGGGGIWNTGVLELTKSTVSGNSATTVGGGIQNRSSGGNITLTNSTVSGNSAVGAPDAAGGGFWNDNAGTLTLTNSTVSGNSAVGVEGACGGICNQGFGTLTLTNSLVALNTATQGAPDLANGGGATVTARFSLIGDGTESSVTGTDGNQVGTADAPIDPKLGPLAFNGGPTQTHALLRRSPAIDAASNPDCPSTDQRGVRRPQGPVCDIGSYERAVQRDD